MKTVRQIAAALRHPALVAGFHLVGIAACAAALFGSGELAATFSP